MLCAFLIFEAFVVCLFVPAFFLERAMTPREAAHKSLSFPDLNYFLVSRDRQDGEELRKSGSAAPSQIALRSPVRQKCQQPLIAARPLAQFEVKFVRIL